MNKGDPRKVLRTRPQWKRGWRHYLRENANISALHMHFLFTSFMFFQDSELQFYLWMSNECYFTKSVQDSCGSEGRIGAPLFFDQQYKSVYRRAYARTQNENMQIKWRAAWLSLGLFVRSKISVLGFPTRNTPVSKLIWVRGDLWTWRMESSNHFDRAPLPFSMG